MIDITAIGNILDSEGFYTGSNVGTVNGTELWKHIHNIPAQPLLTQTLNAGDVLSHYQGATKELNKLKRLDPNEKIIDGYDIDWTGFKVEAFGEKFEPKTSFELFDLIFRYLNYLHALHINNDVIWNDPDNGEQRDDTHQLNWCDKNQTDADLLNGNKTSGINWGDR